ncbi:MAG: DUF362 domain-containing protein [Oscillospiraceae bacterium]|nr:DUF362 domain-containing protein [Oscillospiraceae bacterium]
MSKVAIIRCESYDETEVKTAIKKGLDLIGGAETFVKPGENILLKPNWIMAVSPERCATTHPSIFRAVCEIFLEAGAKLSYGDSPGRGTSEDETTEAASATGFLEISEELGIPLADFIHGKEIQTEMQTFFVANGPLDADGIISLPKLKTQGFLKLTGAVKNQFGCIPGRRKGAYHQQLPKPADFARMLIDLNMFLSPRLYIMDGIMAMEGNGPMNGDPKKMNVLLLSSDPVALDATVARLVNVNPEYSYTVSLGMQAGHGTYLDSEIELLGDPIESLISYDFNINRNPISNVRGQGVFSFDNDAGVPKPYIEEEKCLRCGVCIEMCPVSPKAINWANNGTDESQPPVYDYSRCIRCFCCQELCPHGAVLIKEPE